MKSFLTSLALVLAYVLAALMFAAFITDDVGERIKSRGAPTTAEMYDLLTQGKLNAQR